MPNNLSTSPEKGKKKTYQEKLASRKYKSPGRFITLLYRVIGSTVLLPAYNPHIVVKDDINKREGPCFLIWNHLSRLDHLYTMKAAYPTRYNMVAGYSEFFRSHLYLVFILNRILPKKVFTQDFGGMRAMHSIIKQNGVVAFAPEGMSSIYGTNQPVVPGTGKFLKHYGIPVYFLKMRGQYLTSTKHFLEIRKGRTEAELSLLYTPDQLNEMTAEEIESDINLKFRHDEFAWTKERNIRWKMHGRSCEHLHEICFRCPKCGEDLTMYGIGNEIRCRSCGNGAVMDDGYAFVPFNDGCVIPDSPSKWVETERAEIIEEIRSDPDYEFSENVKIGKLPEYSLLKKKKTSEICGEGTITWNHDGIRYRGTKDGEAWEFRLGYDTIYSLVIMTSTERFALYVGEQFIEFYPERPSVGKALLITEEMHRMHFNTWKNFPWNDWMYPVPGGVRPEQAVQNEIGNIEE